MLVKFLHNGSCSVNNGKWARKRTVGGTLCSSLPVEDKILLQFYVVNKNYNDDVVV
jgi:hypothetical protein